MELILAKIAVSIATVLGLSVLAERAGPRVAGVLSGYPLGTAILLYFIAIEQGITFASESAVYALPGLIATLTFLYVYFLVSKISVNHSELMRRIYRVFGCILGVPARCLKFADSSSRFVDRDFCGTCSVS